MILLSGISSCNAQNDEKDYELDMNEVKKKMSIMVYKAVEDGGNIKRGRIINDGISDNNSKDLRGFYYLSNSVMYTDAKNNVVYEAYYNENQSIPWRTKKDSGKTVYERIAWGRGDASKGYDSYKKTVYNRDTDRNLMQIETFGKSSKNGNYTSNISHSYKYDSNGNMIEALEYGYEWDDNVKKNIQIVKERSLFQHFNNKKSPIKKLVYDSENQLRSEWTFEYYSNNLIKMEHVKSYQYGQQHDDTKMEYTYDNNNNMISKSVSSTSMGWIGTPTGLNKKEREEYIKETYFGKNLKLETVNHYFTYTYDEYNNQIYSCHYDDREDNALRQLFKTKPCGRTATYKYNQKGDWVEMIQYYEDKPTFIVIRDIEYY